MSDTTLKVDQYKIIFDDGNEAIFEIKSRDVAKLERSGVKMGEDSGAIETYALAFVALERLKRQGLIDFDLPKDAEALEDIADIDMIEDPDAEGEDSGRAASPGKPQN